MHEAAYIKHSLIFRKPAGTSRGVLTKKDSWFIRITDSGNQVVSGIGECSLIPNLSIDNPSDIEDKLLEAIQRIHTGETGNLNFPDYPAIQFGIETALQDLQSGGRQILFPSDFTNGTAGLPINGLIWMGEKNSMLRQIKSKIEQGFKILKMKIGAINFQEELNIIRSIRSEFGSEDLELRLDANGAWDASEARDKLNQIAEFNIHSIEQPISAGQINEMAQICSTSPITIALDEELIGITEKKKKLHTLETIKPGYIIIKPSILGGFRASEEWIEIAEKSGCGWWVSSALESNIGLNAIAQWAASLNNSMAQGLGTGTLFSNNIPSPLEVVGDKLYYLQDKKWDLSRINF